MTGSRTLAYLHEPDEDYLGDPSDTTYKVPGKNTTAEDISFENALMRMGIPSDPETLDAVATTFEGAISLSWTLTEPWWLNHVFADPPTAGGEGSAPYSYTWSFPTDDWRIQSSRWYLGLNYGTGTVERVLKGAVFGQLQATCSVGKDVRISVTGFYGDESYNTSVTPGTLVGKDAPPMVFHGGSLEIPDSTTLMRPQDGTLEINTGARAQRAWTRKPVDAVLGNVETTLDLQKIVTGSSQLDLAYGGSGSVSTGDVDGAADGTLKFTSAGTSSLEFHLDTVTPNTYGWDNFANKDDDALEADTYYINSVSAVAESDESSAL